jgi:FMN reductase [NAD(P)H]
VDFRDILSRRRMVRSYRPDPVPRETLERVVRTIRRAPSGGFSQGARLLVVTDPQTRSRLGEIAGENEFYRDAWISRAPVHVVVLTREEDYHERYRQPDKLQDGREVEWPAPYWYVDAGALFMLLLLAAIDEGLAAGTYGVLGDRVQPLKDVLAIPDDVHFVCVVTLGYPTDVDSVSASSSRLSRARKPLDELVRWESWSP